MVHHLCIKVRFTCDRYLAAILLPIVQHSKVDAIIESVDSISRDERGFPLTQYITNGRISRARYTITHFKQHLRVLRLMSYRMNV